MEPGRFRGKPLTFYNDLFCLHLFPNDTRIEWLAALTHTTRFFPNSRSNAKGRFRTPKMGSRERE